MDQLKPFVLVVACNLLIGCAGGEREEDGKGVSAKTPPPPENGDRPRALTVREEGDLHVVTVYYATDREPLNLAGLPNDWRMYVGYYVWAGIAGLVTLHCLYGVFFFKWRKTLALLTLGGALATAALAHSSTLELQRLLRAVAMEGRRYGSQPHLDTSGIFGVMEYGTCEVSIPPNHKVGQVESPSMLRLEFVEDAGKHVVLRLVRQLDHDDFFGDLRDCIDRSPGKQALVFIHGYNMSFDEAAMRTAQIAYDLRFAGAPICYSWPSQGGWADYTTDEEHVRWTTDHLKSFLRDVVQRTDAKSVHLIAHSMGNRALIEVLKEMTEQRTPFNQVILAAPDVDRFNFTSIVSRITGHAERITLYTSATDRALLASRVVHGNTRAGMSGEEMVIVPGVDTVDVSDVDTSLIGHNYFGGHGRMIDELRSLIHFSLPCEQREWLEKVLHRDGTAFWWVLRDDQQAPTEPPD